MLKEHAFDYINFGDSELIRSDVFPYAIRYYMDNLVQPQTEENYIMACDKVMSLASKNQDVYKFILTQLLESFGRVRMDVVYSYLADRYMTQDGCEQTDSTVKTITDRVNLLKLTEVGAPAPPLVFQDATGLKIKLHQLSAKYTLVVFWSVNCSHCKKVMPFIKAQYAEHFSKGLDIYAVNLDASKVDWLNAVGALNAGWIDVQAAKGTLDPMVKDYAVRVTPKFLLLDRNKRIISKPHNMEELQRDLKTFLVE
jgi:thiol-disulfide isomerase/thioredoxin